MMIFGEIEHYLTLLGKKKDVDLNTLKQPEYCQSHRILGFY